MDALGWLWWGLSSAIGIVWSLAWFLLGGWVSTLAQIGIIVGVIYVLKYGWRRAPQEVLGRTATFGRFFWGWLRARDPGAAPGGAVREVVRTVRVKEFGDVNLSTLMTLVMLVGLVIAGMVVAR